VLDKIIASGVESLTPAERKFLTEISPPVAYRRRSVVSVDLLAHEMISAGSLPKLGGNRPMHVNLVPEFLATLAAPSPSAAYHEYLDRHRPC